MGLVCMHVSKPLLPTPFSRVPPQDLAGIKLNLQLRDYDRMSQDDFIGEAWVDLEKELVPDVLGRPCYSGVWGDGERVVSLNRATMVCGAMGRRGGSVHCFEDDYSSPTQDGAHFKR